ncbi:MAG: TAT-variant-translocated molybdopterin oxidoreductase [Bdellovibrionales bacterium]
METSSENTSQANQTNLEKPQKYWKSLEEYWVTPEWKELSEREFLSSPWFEADIEQFEKEAGEKAENKGQAQEGWARREFLKLMGASLALSSFACVRRPVQKIVPYVQGSPDLTPGIANHYSSVWVDRGEAYGLLVKTREGRPIKLEGLPSHPSNSGRLSARVQGQVLGLYDPDRLNGPRKFNHFAAGEVIKPEDAHPFYPDQPHPFRKTQSPIWADVDKEVMATLKEGGVALLTGSLASPSTQSVIRDFSSATGATHFVWDAVGYDDVRDGQKVPKLRFDKAKVVVSIDTDFLGAYQSPVEYAKAFAQNRKPDAGMSRLVVFESIMSLTGMNADERHRIKPSKQIDVVMALLHAVSASESTRAFAESTKKMGLEEAIKSTAQALLQNRGKSLVVAGGLSTRTEASADLQAAVNALNSVLGNDGATIEYGAGAFVGIQGSSKQMQDLIARMEKGQVKTLLIHKVNPVYAMPADSKFVEALKKVKTVIYFGDRVDETGQYSKYVLPDHHPLENWGDAESQSGVISIQQPTIRPLYDTRAFQDSLLIWSGQKMSWYDYLRNQWSKRAGGRDENAWTETLQAGFVGQASYSGGSRSARGSIAQIKPKAYDGYELVMYEKAGIGDGSSANIAWLQELPDPVSKVCWDNYFMISPDTAKAGKIKEGDVLSVSIGGTKLELPAYIQPGVHDQVIGVAVGYGRTHAGSVGNGIGGNAFTLASWNQGAPIYSGIKVTFEKTSRHSRLANTQSHFNMEGRQIVAQATLGQFQKDPEHIIHRHKTFSIWNDHEYKGHKWGMSIDLNTCTGCAACVVACQAENNIPVVGKKYIIQGREMHWMRIDRYYLGEPNNPQSVVQPMLCQHCDNAPCETVCPVAATTHSAEGLNEMTYNRCVGTRYCSNNCPFKVRRFNWFNYAKIKEPLNMVLNPDVGVRSRGVMEKCTFCVQRITAGKMDAKLQDRKVKDGEIKTACEQTCPTQAIVFGDMNDPGSRVSKLFKEQRTYGVLEEFNVKPSVRYMAKIRNTTADAGAHGHSESSGHGSLSQADKGGVS